LVDGSPGHLGGVAAMLIMTIMYSARVARFDTMKACCFLAKRIARWDLGCDRRIHRFSDYITKYADDISYGWIGDLPALLTAHLFVDSSLADCPYSLKSGMGIHFDIQGPNSRFPIGGSANTQTSVAHSSTCAEVGACNSGMKTRAEPAFQILSLFLSKYHSIGDENCGGSPPTQCEGLFDPKGRIDNHYHSQAAQEYISRNPSLPAKDSIRRSLGRWCPVIYIHEDNTTCIIAYTTGKNPTMKDLERAFGISLA